MPAESLEREIRDLRAALFSERDPEGRGFAPLADALRRAGDLAQALELVEEGVERLPSFATGHVVSGWVHRARGDDTGAERAFRRVLGLDEENVSALRGLGFLLADRGDETEALDVFRRLDELDPGDLEVQARLLELGGEPAPAAPSHTGADAVPVESLAPGEAARPVVDVAKLAPDDLLPERPVVAVAELAPDGGESRPVVDVAALAPDAPSASGAGEASQAVEGAGTTGSPESPDAGETGAVVALPGAGTTPGAGDGTEAGGRGPWTRTMAELYVRQGLTDRALRVYRRLVERSPDDRELRDRLEELESDPAAVGAEDDEAELEDLAREMADGPSLAEEPEGPFAWGGAPDAEPEERAGGEGEGDGAGAPASEYLRGLLEWTPGTGTGGDEEDPRGPAGS